MHDNKSLSNEAVLLTFSSKVSDFIACVNGNLLHIAKSDIFEEMVCVHSLGSASSMRHS